jgi:3-oxoacyl-[acyl-carrier protein] reductase
MASDVDATKKVLDLISFLMSDRADLISGKIISAEWDNWAEWPNHVEELNGSDIYTLRRITGRERRSTWGDIQ